MADDNETPKPERGPMYSSGLVGVTRDPLVDGRQSDRALDIRRGTCRHLVDLGFAPIPELTLASGRRADIVAVSPRGDVWIIEIKSSLADYRSDSKWEDYSDYCDLFSFAVDAEFPIDVIPQSVGLMVADRFGAEIVREATGERLSAARRKAVTLSFARTGALRMRAVVDRL